ncbi:related to GTPase-activating protein (GAP) [Fusarium oxysporum]|uniref:GTPase-activating protein GYP5 n=1 Tax=Fusarium oxysporum TaxID=5507 RepID=A0A2H3SRU3_FUSOX|nr:related to GTPase-activating protein (GAP) [Fusarium oxysporum]
MSQPQDVASPVAQHHIDTEPEKHEQQQQQKTHEMSEKQDGPEALDEKETTPTMEDKQEGLDIHKKDEDSIAENHEDKAEDNTEVKHEDKHEEKPEETNDKPEENQQEQLSQNDTNVKRLSSGTESDDTMSASDADDKFEDAVTQSPARSLTKRNISQAKRRDSEVEEPTDRRSEESHPHEDTLDTKVTQHKVTGSEAGSVKGEQSRRKPSIASTRISNTSNLDNVSLDDDTPPSPVPKDLPPKPNSKTISLNSISLPSMPWSPAADTSKSPVPPAATLAPTPPVPQPPPPPSRKLTSPFSWLSRSSSKEREPPLPPPPAGRRNTAGSIATLSSNPEMMLSRLEEEKDGDSLPGDPAQRVTLKDRFKQLRQQEEAARAMAEGDSSKYDGALGLTLPGDEGQPQEKPPSSPVPQPIPGLAPGTVAGVNAGPSAISEEKVDWDLWQSVVYEGPAAVARTSAEELNKAIATGIPSAIRGVVWQVLADSKNDDLELVYKDLVARGTDKSKDRHSNSTTASSLSNGNLSVHSGDAVTSSASSINSDHSGTNGTPSPKEKSAEAVLKAQAAAAAERKRKDKEDAATLQKLEKTIRRDLGARTSYSKYAAAAGLQEGLFGVCKAYALFDEGVGYAQGMNFLIMPLLFNMPEQEAFCLLVRLMNHYKLRDLFIQDMPGLHMHLYQFERLLEDFEPALYCHLHRRGISPHLYATQWFLTLFAYRFPLQLVLRIYDLIFSEGLSAILRFGIVLMQKNASILLGLSDMQQLTTYLKDKLFDVYIDKDPSHGSLLENGFFGSSSSSIDKEVYRADQLVKDACEVKITPEMLKSYSTEWEEKTKAEKDRENELLELRTANHNLSIQVRKLEERVEVCDREQADLATELVHTKVENQELRDENDSMRGQVRELKIVIEKQPMEIEETWKLERDDLMKRNMHVHEENQRLEKELSELEEELVQTKLRYAEINSQHETLNRKWTDLKRQFA